MISLMAAVDENNVIGKDGAMPWSLPADLAFFKKKTLGHTIVMGRKTFKAIGSKPLPGRDTIIVTRDTSFVAEGCKIMHSIDEVMELVRSSKEEVFVIGGGELFKQFMVYADTIYLTKIYHEFQGDTYFPKISDVEWSLAEQEGHKAKGMNKYDYSFLKFIRIKL